jgi:heat shock protein HtpX
MKWDLWNPWANLFELASSHPLPAKRIRALGHQTEAFHQVPRYKFRLVRPESYWDEFLMDLLVHFLPLLGLLAGAGLAVHLFFAGHTDIIGGIGATLLLLSAAAWLKRRVTYRHDFKDKRTVKSLVGEVKVSGVRPIPCMIEGKIIGRGIPGLFYSEDLVLQDHTGFMIVDYRQPLRIWEFFFGWMKSGDLVGQVGTAIGWYRRAPRPYFEMRRMTLKSGQTVTSYLYPVVQFFVYAGIIVGAFLLLTRL